jgi:hypothetical protein
MGWGGPKVQKKLKYGARMFDFKIGRGTKTVDLAK